MTRKELVKKVSADFISDYTQAEIEMVLLAAEKAIVKAVAAGEEVALAGFGTFSRRFRSARLGVNPRQPDIKLKMPAMYLPKFKAGRVFKEEVKSVVADSQSETDDNVKADDQVQSEVQSAIDLDHNFTSF